MVIRLDTIEAAARRIAGKVHRTPQWSCQQLGQPFGIELHLKAELFQKTGSFKVRGVLNKLAAMDDETRQRGLVSMSAGNHAAALAWGAAAAGARATVVMPRRAARSKIDASLGYGGEIVLTGGDLMAEVDRLRSDRGLVMVHPFDDPAIMAGHGTIGLEILEDLPDVDLVVVPIGGGGLIGGVAAAIKLARPSTRIIGVEPEGADAMSQALAAGKPVPIGHPHTIADGLAAPFAGELPLEHVKRFVDDVVRVSEESIEQAWRLVLTRSKLAAEPSGAAPLAALLESRIALDDVKRAVLVVSGGNLDAGRLARACDVVQA